jgi:LuxR family transcriptional regulator, maltose regulon positive regulatory protein
MDGSSSRPPARRQAPAANPFLAAKIAVPALPEWVVRRERIETRIAAGAQGPLTVITGPPGAGKTVAMASWASTHSDLYPTAWVTLDEDYSCLRVFWPYLLEALRHAGIPISRRVAAAASTGSADQGFVLQLAAAITAQQEPIWLVLDDFHLLTGRAQLTGLARLLRNARPALHVVVASRGDPVFPLHRYRLAGELTEIREDELAFTVAEASLLMAQHDVTLPGHTLEYLTERAEGWAAALRLAALSITGSPDPEQSAKEIASGEGAVASYLMDEVLNTRPPRVRNLLLKTSILDRISPEIATEVAEDKHAVSELRALADANAFVQPLPQGWYRYHSMFAEVLRLKLRREAPDEVPVLRHRAARSLQRHGRITEAVQQAAAADDWPLAARIVVDELAVGQLMRPEGLDPLAEVLRHMPQDHAWPQPQPHLVLAALNLHGQSSDAPARSLGAAEEMLRKLPRHEEIPSRLTATLIRLGLARRTGDLPTAKAAVADAVALVDRLPPEVLERHVEIRAQVMGWQALVEFWWGNFASAAAVFRTAAASSRGAYERAAALGRLALLEAIDGHLSSAAALAADEADVIKRDLVTGPPHRTATLARACVHLQRYELHDARRCLQEADAALRACPDKVSAGIASMVAARGCLAEGRHREASEIVARVRDRWSPPPWLDQQLALVESRAFTAAGMTEAALDAARRAGPEQSGEAAAALARTWLAAGNAPAARRALAAAEGPLEDARDHVRVEIGLVEGRLALLSGEPGNAVRSVQQAFRFAQAERLRLPFILERDWLRPLVDTDPDLAQAYNDVLALRRARDAAIGRQAGSRKPAAQSQAAAALPTQDAPLVVESLTEREREVLQHVSQLLPTVEIASEMYVSVNTVKSHLKSIFRKLGAATRNEAVRRARQLELI